MVGRMDIARCGPCCYPRCRLSTDNFNRASVGSGWDDISGTWSISSNALTTGDSNAIILWDADHPAGVAAHIAEVWASTTTAGEKARVLVASNSTGTTYLGVEVEFGASTGDQCGTIRLFSEAGTLHSRPMLGLPPNVPVRILVCYLEAELIGEGASGGELWAHVFSPTTCNTSISSLATATGLRVGLGTGASSPNIKFDDFSWYSHDIEGHETYGSCSSCWQCLIWEWDGTTTSNCEQTVDGDPTNLTGDPWSVEGLIAASDVSSYGIVVPNPPGDITLTLGDYSAHFYVSGSNIRVDLTGPGVSVTEDFPDSVVAALSYINGQLCATTGYDLSGNKSAFGTPTDPVGTTASVSAPAGAVSVIQLTACPQCPSDTGCSSCEPAEETPHYFKVTFGGIGDGTCDGFANDCSPMNGTFICDHRFATFGACIWVGPSNGGSPCAVYPRVLVSGRDLIVDIIKVGVSATNFTDYVFRFKKTSTNVTVTYPCTELSNTDVPFFANGPHAAVCDNAGLQCAISAL